MGLSYSAAIAKYFQFHAADGNTVPLNPILWANAYDAFDPNQLDVNANGSLTYRGIPMAGPASDIPAVLQAPGFFLGSMTCDGTTDFTVDPANPAQILLSPFTVDDPSPGLFRTSAAGIVGTQNVAFADSLGALMENVRKSSIIPSDEVDRVEALIKHGVICCPAPQTVCQNLYSHSFPTLHTTPVFLPTNQTEGSSCWSLIVGQFDDARTNYVQQNYQAAASLAAAAAANADAWNAIYNRLAAIPVLQTLTNVDMALIGEGPIVDYFSSPTGKLAILAGAGVAVLVFIVIFRK